jgi:hypothetical protein
VKSDALAEAGISKSEAYRYEEIAGDRDGQGDESFVTGS